MAHTRTHTHTGLTGDLGFYLCLEGMMQPQPTHNPQPEAEESS